MFSMGVCCIGDLCDIMYWLLGSFYVRKKGNFDSKSTNFLSSTSKDSKFNLSIKDSNF